MSRGAEEGEARASLRALAHPLRLRMLSLLTGSAMTAAEVARELGIAHASASYHLRQLHAAGHLAVAGEERIRGGRAVRYRYDHRSGPQVTDDHGDHDARVLVSQAIAAELVRRATSASPEGPRTQVDAELWVPDEAWAEVVDLVRRAGERLHDAARPPRTPGTRQVNATIALFPMEDP